MGFLGIEDLQERNSGKGVGLVDLNEEMKSLESILKGKLNKLKIKINSLKCK